VLKIASGDTVRVETMVAGGLERLKLASVPDTEIPDSLKRIENSVTDVVPEHILFTGPIYVQGAEPGDIVEVKILGFEFLHPYGVTGFRPGAGTLPDDFPYARLKLIRIDAKAGSAAFGPGVTLKLAPFWGSIGVAPPVLIRRLSSGPPGAHAGNPDNKELVAGSSLYLPMHVPGALISLDSSQTSSPQGARLWEGYKSISEGKRASMKAGERIPLKGVHVQTVSSNGEVIAKAINGGKANPLCAGAQNKGLDPTENVFSLGFLLTYGKFKFLDGGDLTYGRRKWNSPARSTNWAW